MTAANQLAGSTATSGLQLPKAPGALSKSRIAAILVSGSAALLIFASPAQAAERVTLRNGFELTCDHRGVSNPPDSQDGAKADLAGRKVRLFLDPSEANYVDVAPGEILAAEALPAVAPAAVTASATPLAPAAVTASATPLAPDRTNLSPAELRELLTSAGSEHNLDVDLLASLIHAESASQAHAVSRAGAQGLMQLMPATAAQLGVHDAFVPEANVHGGTAYLDSLLKRYHDNLALALAAYNAGPGAVDRYHGVPPYRETRAYVERIIHEFNQRYAARQAAGALAMARR